MSARFLAFDLGAESGRAILGRLDGGVLALKDIYRFPNEPVRNNGSLQWDILRLWHEMRKGLELVSDISLASVGLDTWGCDYALLGETGNLLENPYHYRDPRTDGDPGRSVPARVRRAHLQRHRHPVSPVQHAVPVVRRQAIDAAAARRGHGPRHHS